MKKQKQNKKYKSFVAGEQNGIYQTDIFYAIFL